MCQHLRPTSPAKGWRHSMFYDEAAARAAWSKTMAFLSEHLPAR